MHRARIRGFLAWLFHLWAFDPDESLPASAALPGVAGEIVLAADPGDLEEP